MATGSLNASLPLRALNEVSPRRYNLLSGAFFIYYDCVRFAVLSNLAAETLKRTHERAAIKGLGVTLTLRFPQNIVCLWRPGARASLRGCGCLKSKKATVEIRVAGML